MQSAIKHEESNVAQITEFDVILRDYEKQKTDLEEVSRFITEHAVEVDFFIHAARTRGEVGYFNEASVFNLKEAQKALDAEYWDRVVNMTDVLEYMPAKDRNKWVENISECQTPEFTRENVRATIGSMLANRQKFFSERVDGIFRILSGDHVTNIPQGFGKRMIMANVVDTTNDYGNSYIIEYIHDLRAVIARFMQREFSDTFYRTKGDLEYLSRTNQYGKWVEFDGGALKMKLFKKGTVHLEIHSMMAYQLNKVLADLYPKAIPSTFRQKPIKCKEPELKTDLFSSKILNELRNIRSGIKDDKLFTPLETSDDIKNILMYIGCEKNSIGYWTLPYPILDTIQEILRTGGLPDKKSHQAYHTPASLGEKLVQLAGIEPDHRILEPSAGIGGIAKYLPVAQTECIEINTIHSSVLRGMGFSTTTIDFLKWETTERFDRIVMNPPFTAGQAEAHLKKAINLLKPKGRLVAVLPASLRGREYATDCSHEWSQAMSGEFIESGTAVNITILVLTRY